LLKKKTNVFIKYNQVIVTIHKPEYNDEYHFTCLAKRGTILDTIDRANKTINIHNVKGKCFNRESMEYHSWFRQFVKKELFGKKIDLNDNCKNKFCVLELV